MPVKATEISKALILSGLLIPGAGVPGPTHHYRQIQEDRRDVTGYDGQHGYSHIHQVDLQLRAVGRIKETWLQT